MGHNNWTTYVEGSRWRVVFDIVPRTGYRVLMDGLPGIIASDDDFGVNTGGLMVTETTIARFHGWDPSGKPEFVRARKAMQYAGSIDEFARKSCSTETTAATPTTGCSATARPARSRASNSA